MEANNTCVVPLYDGTCVAVLQAAYRHAKTTLVSKTKFEDILAHVAAATKTELGSLPSSFLDQILQHKVAFGWADTSDLSSKQLDEVLLTSSFLNATAHATIVDVAVYAALESTSQQGSLKNLGRWIDYMSHMLKGTDGKYELYTPSTGLGAIANVAFVSKKEQPKQDKAAPATPASMKEQQKQDKKVEKKENPAKEAKPKAEDKNSAAAAASVDPNELDIRVGKIVSVKKHEDADSLYVEQIDLGEPSGPRTIVSGLVKHVPIEEMQDRSVLVLCNLKPSKMRGVVSEGMVLCTSQTISDTEYKAVPLAPPSGSSPGDIAVFASSTGAATFERKEKKVIDPKKKTNAWSAVQPHFKTTEAKAASYSSDGSNTLMLVTSKGQVEGVHESAPIS